MQHFERLHCLAPGSCQVTRMLHTCCTQDLAHTSVATQLGDSICSTGEAVTLQRSPQAPACKAVILPGPACNNLYLVKVWHLLPTGAVGRCTQVAEYAHLHADGCMAAAACIWMLKDMQLCCCWPHVFLYAPSVPCVGNCCARPPLHA